MMNKYFQLLGIFIVLSPVHFWSGQEQKTLDKATKIPQSMTQHEWKSIVIHTAFHVTREKGFSSPLYNNHASNNKSKHMFFCDSRALFVLIYLDRYQKQ